MIDFNIPVPNEFSKQKRSLNNYAHWFTADQAKLDGTNKALQEQIEKYELEIAEQC